MHYIILFPIILKMEMLLLILFSTLFVCSLVIPVLGDFGVEEHTSSSPRHCSDLNPQNSVDLEQIMGMWYGSEIFVHNDNNEGVYHYNTCIMIHITEANDHQISTTTDEPFRDDSYARRQKPNFSAAGKQKFLSLTWDENNVVVLQYILRYNESRLGHWISSGSQKGTFVNFQYSKFSGTVQVMKAVVNQLILTFCQPGEKGLLFTIVLARKANSLTYDELVAIKKLLTRRGLSTQVVRKVCENGGETRKFSFLMLTVAAILAWKSHF